MKDYQKPDKKKNRAVVNLRDINGWSFKRIGTKLNLSGEGARKIYNKMKKNELPKVPTSV